MMIHAEVMKSTAVQVKAKYPERNNIGTLDKNHILNLIVQDVEFPYGLVNKYVTNNITENMYT